MNVTVLRRMSQSLARAVVIVALGGSGGGALAATYLHRCGPDGRTYSQTPCRSAPGTVLKVPGDASGTRQAERIEGARRESRLARTLEADRRRRQKELPMGGASNIPVRPVSVGEPEPQAKKAPRRPKDFTARVPKPPKP